ncbi:MAG TPA: serine/threonine-protein kinase [Steroidobacteraceae bacterium]|nr:serine/threonine-protein kinase [Steroidobacteraceae bacterium]
MSSQLDEILHALAGGSLSIDQACTSINAAVRANPSGTRMWGMLLEGKITQQLVSAAAGRQLLDALENFEPEKTMWLAPKRAESKPQATPLAQSTQVIAIEAKRTVPRDAEQLRAFLWDSPADNSAATESIDHPTASVAWMEAPVQRVQPPRPKPGVTPVIPAPELGAIIKGRYRLDSHLGFGGIGQVFSAIDLEAQHADKPEARVTIKMIAVDLKCEPNALPAMQRAVQQAKSLRHPNIVATYGVETDNDRLFVIMEPLAGRWLGDLVRQVRDTGLAPDAAWPIVAGIAEGLAHAHRHNVVHSDLSPYAVFLDAKGSPKIMGFGLIRALPTSNEAMDLLDTMTLRAYSEAYTADAWATHAAAHSADDLYPLGVIAYELLTGHHPFQRQSLTVARQRQLALQPIPRLGRRRAKLLERCLSFERKQWPGNASDFLDSLRGPALLRLLLGNRSAAASR